MMASKNKDSVQGKTSWQLQEAKACFSEVVRRARQCPQRVTVHGKEAVVVISAEKYAQITSRAQGDLAELMASSPLSDIDFDQRREVMPVREVEL